MPHCHLELHASLHVTVLEPVGLTPAVYMRVLIVNTVLLLVRRTQSESSWIEFSSPMISIMWHAKLI